MLPDFYSSYLQMIVNRLLNKDPTQRPSSEDLTMLLEQELHASRTEIIRNQSFNSPRSVTGFLIPTQNHSNKL